MTLICDDVSERAPRSPCRPRPLNSSDRPGMVGAGVGVSVGVAVGVGVGVAGQIAESPTHTSSTNVVWTCSDV